ncbi:MAG: DUF4864 domain-containing protein [Roseovarius sp.]
MVRLRLATAALFLLVSGVAFGLAPAARADSQAIRDVISSQIDAFLADDVEAAFDHASPTIRQIFGTPERFGEMVQRGYPMVWRPAEVTFLSTEERGGRLFQNVMVRDGAGVLHILEYEMIEGASGWKIDGVRLRAPAAGAA